MPFPTRRLVGVLGADFEQPGATSITRLIGQVEESDLELKGGPYATTDAGRAEAAKDIAAFANAQGGLIVIGVQEADGRATALAPWEVTEGDELRVREIVTERVVPYVDVAVRRVASDDPLRGYMLIAVPQSADAPHAVRRQDSLRYPVRDGRRTRYMAEAEVANTYRQRFTMIDAREERLKAVRHHGLGTLPLDGDQALPWLAVSLVPLRPARLSLDSSVRGIVERRFKNAVLTSCPGTPFHGQVLNARVGVRHVQLTDSLAGNEPPRRAGAVLHADRAAFVAAAFWPWDMGQHALDEFRVPHEELTSYVLGLLGLACEHAVATGTGGDAIVDFEIIRPSTGRGHELVLLEQSQFSPAFEMPRMDEPPEYYRYSVPIQAVVESGTELVAAAYQALVDIEASFGQPEPSFIFPKGAVSTTFGARFGSKVKDWVAPVTSASGSCCPISDRHASHCTRRLATPTQPT